MLDTVFFLSQNAIELKSGEYLQAASLRIAEQYIQAFGNIAKQVSD